MNLVPRFLGLHAPVCVDNGHAPLSLVGLDVLLVMRLVGGVSDHKVVPNAHGRVGEKRTAGIRQLVVSLDRAVAAGAADEGGALVDAHLDDEVCRHPAGMEGHADVKNSLKKIFI